MADTPFGSNPVHHADPAAPPLGTTSPDALPGATPSSLPLPPMVKGAFPGGDKTVAPTPASWKGNVADQFAWILEGFQRGGQPFSDRLTDWLNNERKNWH